MKATAIAIAAAMSAWAAVPFPPPATHVPVRWTVETSRVQPAAFDAYQGETLELEAAMQSYGKPFAIAGEDARIYWQTNGMGAAWWSAPASVRVGKSGERDTYAASWTPDMDAGAGVYNCFIGQPSGNYRAEFRLRLRPSPGTTPNTLRLPDVTVDARLNGTPTVNGTNLVDFVKLEAGAETDPTVPDWAKQPNPPKTGAVDSVNGKTGTVSLAAADVGALPTDGGNGVSVGFGSGPQGWAFLASTTYFGGMFADVIAGVGGWDSFQIYGSGQTLPEYLAETCASSDEVRAIGSTVNAWQTYWDGDDVRLTVTNYYGSLATPSLYIEQKMSADDNHDAPWFRVVWDERTRWNSFMPAFTAVTNEVAQNKADRAWGVYDSSSGAYSPDDMLQISQSRVMIAPGMAWQKTVVVGGGAVWVLRSTLPVEMSGTDENGFFRIEDGDGHALFEIVKGDKQIKPATSVSATKTTGGFSVGYRADSPVHPVGEVCFDLTDGTWIPEDDLDTYRVTWSGERPNWTATVEPVGPRALPDKLFFKASYEAGGNTYIRHDVATSMDKVVIGGREYMVTVENVGGKNLMVLK